MKLAIRRRRTASERALTAASWWAACIDATDTTFDNGEILHEIIAQSTFSTRKIEITESQREAFVQQLARLIDVYLAKQAGSWNHQIEVGVDYEVDDFIHTALQTAGLSTRQFAYNFPWKTRMTITPDLVSVKVGYSATDEAVVWQAATAS
jgi:hypothetical protein